MSHTTAESRSWLDVLVSAAEWCGVPAATFQKLYDAAIAAQPAMDPLSQAGRLERLQRINSLGQQASALCRFYPAHQLITQGLSPVSVHVRDSRLDLPLVIPEKWRHGPCEITKPDSEDHQIASLPAEYKRLSAEQAAGVAALTKAKGQRIWDQPVYRLLELGASPGKVRAKFTLDTFLHYRLGLGAMPDELVHALVECDGSIDDVVGNVKWLPIRRQLMPDAASILDLGRRLCVGGVNVTFAMRRPAPWNDFAIPIQRRSRMLSADQFLLAVLPTAYHQHGVDPDVGIRFGLTVLREVFEELFGGDEVQRNVSRLREDWFLDESPPLRWLQRHAGQWKMTITGSALNLSQGNYELAILFVVEDPTFWKKFSSKMVSSWESEPELSPLVGTRNEKIMNIVLAAKDWNPPSYWSLCLGLKLLAECDRSSVSRVADEYLVRSD